MQFNPRSEPPKTNKLVVVNEKVRKNLCALEAFDKNFEVTDKTSAVCRIEKEANEGVSNDYDNLGVLDVPFKNCRTPKKQLLNQERLQQDLTTQKIELIKRLGDIYKDKTRNMDNRSPLNTRLDCKDANEGGVGDLMLERSQEDAGVSASVKKKDEIEEILKRMEERVKGKNDNSRTPQEANNDGAEYAVHRKSHIDVKNNEKKEEENEEKEKEKDEKKKEKEEGEEEEDDDDDDVFTGEKMCISPVNERLKNSWKLAKKLTDAEMASIEELDSFDKDGEKNNGGIEKFETKIKNRNVLSTRNKKDFEKTGEEKVEKKLKKVEKRTRKTNETTDEETKEEFEEKRTSCQSPGKKLTRWRNNQRRQRPSNNETVKILDSGRKVCFSDNTASCMGAEERKTELLNQKYRLGKYSEPLCNECFDDESIDVLSVSAKLKECQSVNEWLTNLVCRQPTVTENHATVDIPNIHGYVVSKKDDDCLESSRTRADPKGRQRNRDEFLRSPVKIDKRQKLMGAHEHDYLNHAVQYQRLTSSKHVGEPEYENILRSVPQKKPLTERRLSNPNSVFNSVNLHVSRKTVDYSAYPLGEKLPS